MSVSAEKLREQLANLDSKDRAELARFLIESLESEASDGSDFDAELERRASEIKADQAKGEPADRVFSELREKHS